VQQSGGNTQAGIQRSPDDVKNRPDVIQRAPSSPPIEQKLYYRLSGANVHELVEKRLLSVKKNSNLIVEAPIPGATSSRKFEQGNPDNFDRVGRADLYTSTDAGAAIGVRGYYETAELKADPENTPRHYTDFRSGATQTRSGKIKWRPDTTNGKINGAFPDNFQVADLKPLSVTKGGEGWAQIGNYIAGTHNFAEQARKDGVLTKGNIPNGGPLNDLAIPPGLDYREIDREGRVPGEGNIILGGRRFWVAEGKDSGLYYYMNLAHPAPTKAARKKEDEVLGALTPVKKALAIPATGCTPRGSTSEHRGSKAGLDRRGKTLGRTAIKVGQRSRKALPQERRRQISRRPCRCREASQFEFRSSFRGLANRCRRIQINRALVRLDR
jgi:hypothetical protein